ncbi:MAG: hypothetical protein R2751_00085 [Bacteroidales bacterium]
MKTNGRIGFFVAFLCLGSTAMWAQEKKEDKTEQQQKELQQKKEILEKDMQQMQELKQQQEAWSFFEDQQRMTERDNRAVRAEARVRSSTGFPMVFSDDGEGAFVYSMGDDVFSIRQNSSQLILRNTFKGGTDTSEGEFEVEDGTQRFRCMINGRVRSGEITIRVKYPNGKVFKELTITSSAEVTFNQSNTIGDEQKDKYTGTWSYSVKADKADGNYMLQISTN